VAACDTILEIVMKVFTVVAISIAVLVQSLTAQAPSPKEPKEPTEKEKEEIDSGIPINSELVRKTCSPCHKVDDKLRLSRISWRRTTPEGWEQTIKRMIGLDGLKVEPAEAREILKYLSNNLGLAP
jgi:quinohemoprotein amine dehydrogenase